jgi:RNA polymerase sigma-70 factor (ECF subfamily)
VNHDDARDLANAIAGDHEAFARIYDRHAAVVLSLCRARTASQADLASAEDACQETFIRAFKLLPRVNGQVSGSGGLRPWLYAIARRVCSEARRSLGRRRIHEGNAMIVMISDQSWRTADSTHGASQSDVSAEQLDRLSRALGQLDDREHLAIHLHYLEVNPEQAAREALGLSRSGYYKVLSRAKDKLADMLVEQPVRVP